MYFFEQLVHLTLFHAPLTNAHGTMLSVMLVKETI